MAVTVVWALSLLAAAMISAHRSPPTVREQRDLAHADVVVDRAVGELAAAATPLPVLSISADTVTQGCRISPLREGALLRRTLVLAAPEPQAAEALRAIARRLPPRYRPTIGPDAPGGAPELHADAGGFVAVRGTLNEPGEVTLTLDSGCRPAAPLPAAAVPDGRDPAAVAPVLAALGAAPAQPAVAQAPCPGGGAIRTVTARSRTAAPALLADALRPLTADASVIVDQPAFYAYQRGSTTVSVRGDGDTVSVVSTTSCP
ncbi:hypothetical protein [Micromonospora endolithica]|uniref:hypothetical protein n=1 Tax=Micromonospora endolithica TaxID=230091 RepID=UPI0011BF8DC6|nr:hypothetical protein [Micromonospora endolithica]